MTQLGVKEYYSAATFMGANEEEPSRLNLATRLVARCYSFNDCGFKHSYKIIVV